MACSSRLISRTLGQLRHCGNVVIAPMDAADRVFSPWGPPATLGSTAAGPLRLIVWCKDCRHQVEPNPAEMAERYGAETTVLDWAKRLVCSRCGSRNVDFVVSGTKRDPLS